MSFYAALSSVYDQVFPASELQIAFLKKHLSGRVLDVGAGTGTLMLHLSPHLEQVDGLEYSPEMVALAREKLAGTSNTCIKTGDMCQIQDLFDGPYDCIYCVGNTLPHLQGPQEILEVFRQVYGLLKPSGHLILQTVNFHQVLQQKHLTFPVLGRGDLTFQRTYTLQDGKVLFSGKVEQQGKTLVAEQTRLYPIQQTEMESLLREAGFQDLTFWGDFKENSFQQDAGALVVLAHKRDQF